ncbi:MAG: PEGA domain-containing protein [Verrucomicrobiota bacterium]
MASFGSFETDREVYSDLFYTVYAARKSGDPEAEYAVKVFAVQRLGLATETMIEREALPGNLERSPAEAIAVQKKGAAASTFITPVLETGHDERGVWYATKFYPRSVNKILSGRVTLTRDALHHIIRSIAQGALDLKRVCGRSHGDIRASHVQMGKSEKLSEAEVVLSDPLPGGEAAASRYEICDLRAIGQILLQLVRHRGISSDQDFLILPILGSPEWTRVFGRDIDRWLSLCNRLLDPNLSLDGYTLEQLVAELDQLGPTPGVSRVVIMAGSAVLVLLGAGTLVVWWMTGYQKVEIASDPPGATILIDKTEAGKTPLQLKLRKGAYTVEARHEALHLPEQSTNWLLQGRAPSMLQFQFPYGSVAILSDPPGATIARDRVVVDRTPLDGRPFFITNVPPGLVKYQLNLDQHESADLVGVVTNRQQLVLRATLRQVRLGEGLVEFDSDPAGARIFKQGEFLTETPARRSMAEGTYNLTAVYRDWPPKQLSVEVKAGVEVKEKVYFENGRVSINSDPPAATVWVGTNLIGKTPTVVVRPAGTTTFRFELTGFEAASETVTLTDKSNVSVRPVLLSTNGLFEFSASPAAAMILDATGRELGRASSDHPLQVTVAPGTYSFMARTEGLSDMVKKFEVTKRQIIKYTFEFDCGAVRFESIPAGASISVDGRALGITPSTFLQKPGVKIPYRIAATDYLPSTNPVVVQSREMNKIVVVPLVPEPVSVALTSDPPGAKFYFGSAPLPGPGYEMPWGTNVVIAKHPLYPWLEAVTNTFAVKKGAVNSQQIKFSYGTVEFETTPRDAKAEIFEHGQLVGRTPTTLFVRSGRVDYELIYKNQTNHMGTNVMEGGTHRLITVFAPTAPTPTTLETITNSVGMIFVKVRNDFWVGQSKLTWEQYSSVLQEYVVKTRQPKKPAEVSWTDAITFCATLAANEFSSGKLPTGLSYSLPKTDEWTIMAKIRSLASALVVEETALNAAGNGGEWCFTTQGKLSARAPRIVVTHKGSGELQVDSLKPLDRDVEGPTVRCVLAQPRDER